MKPQMRSINLLYRLGAYNCATRMYFVGLQVHVNYER